MASSKFTAEVKRDAILKALTDAEVERVSSEEGASALRDGEEYVDLEHLELGVQSAAAGKKLAASNMVPRNAVSSESWAEIVALLRRPA